VERAYSAYWHLRHYGGETLSFQEALEAEPERLESTGGQLKASGFIKYAYFSGGCYGSQIKTYLDCFPRENFQFFVTDDLKTGYSQTMNIIYDFLGVKSIANQKARISNQASRIRSRSIYQWIRRKSIFKEFLKPFISTSSRYKLKNLLQKMIMTSDPYPPMDSTLARILRCRYLDEIVLLESLIGRDLSSWKVER
jgi:hypothetical protein